MIYDRSQPLYLYQFLVINNDEKMPVRIVFSLLDPEAVAQVASEGYVRIEGLLTSEQLAELRACVDRVRGLRYVNDERSTYGSGRFGGQYLRDLHAHDDKAWPLLVDGPLIDTVRSVLGPRLVLRSYSARITFAGSQAETVWHCDQRAGVDPKPPWFTTTHSVTVLVYLDDIDEYCGRTSLIPRSHQRGTLPDEQGDYPDAVAFDAVAGDALLFHGALWHRAGPNTTRGRLRRVLNLQFAPSWAKLPGFEELPDRPLWSDVADEARLSGRTDVLELLGLGGYM
jgi:hypothetical protein